jgi:hypothetical protein
MRRALALDVEVEEEVGVDEAHSGSAPLSRVGESGR